MKEGNVSAVLWKKWVKLDQGKIEGYWAEDGSSYQIHCPAQLVDKIIAIQNSLSEGYTEIQLAKQKVYDLATNFPFSV